MEDSEILKYVNLNHPTMINVKNYLLGDEEDKALSELMSVLKVQMAQRYYFNWHEFEGRLNRYTNQYPGIKDEHIKGAEYFYNIYSPTPSWNLPSKNKKGEEVTAYELRHLARQSWGTHIALSLFLAEDNKWKDYQLQQVNSLNNAFMNDDYEDAGNGVYEVYRAGRRVHKWLLSHNIYLAHQGYSQEEQILMVKTLLHHGAQLKARTEKNRYGNHHTKGLVALFEIGILFPEFIDSDIWIKQAIEGLVWHIMNEINMDGFQFERSVHYHIGDIENYYRVFQLAKINGLELPVSFADRFRSMFDSIIKLAQPNKRLPVLQDDTDLRYAENNLIDDAMIMGSVIFNDPSYGYLVSNNISSERYWLVPERFNRKKFEDYLEPPGLGSTSLEETGYYTMRSGWDSSSLYLTVSAGVSHRKPDHQHGDVLGVVAWANGHEILPNYQVKYSFDDYILWKNSWTKSVALVDSMEQGRNWKPNRGGSGFGKWLVLPEPSVKEWFTSSTIDYFKGAHDGYENYDGNQSIEKNVSYSREIFFMKPDFWVFKDSFQSIGSHSYQQNWQGKFESLGQLTINKTFEDGTGVLIKQLTPNDGITIIQGEIPPKFHTYYSISDKKDHVFTSAVVPYQNYELLNEFGFPHNSEWKLISYNKEMINSDAELIFKNNDQYLFLNGSKIEMMEKAVSFDKKVNFLMTTVDKTWTLRLLGSDTIIYESNGRLAESTGEMVNYLTTDKDYYLKWTSK